MTTLSPILVDVHRTSKAVLLAAMLSLTGTCAPAPTAAAYPTDSSTCPGTEAEICYSSAQMAAFAETGGRMIADYLAPIVASPEALPALRFIPSAGTASSNCVDVNGNSDQHDRSFDYCRTDNTVFIGQDSLWDAYHQFGAAGPLSGMAHEYGHFLQSVAGVPLPITATDTIRNENQADCFSGAFIGYLRHRDGIAHPGDIDSVEHYLTATASGEAPGRDHGTAPERIQSFDLGYTGALPACNEFYPATPLLKQ